MEHEHYSYPDALRYLAKKYNIEIAEEQPSPKKPSFATRRKA
jgi:DNA primase